jgi:hypothetical protein
MRDDLIQGITFSRSEMIDLRRLSRRERMIFKMLATKKSLQQLTTRPTSIISTTPRTFVVIRDGAARQQDLKQLRDRLKQF